MIFKTIPLGALGTNCYLISAAEGHAVIVDPAVNGEMLAKRLEEMNLQLDAILLTHGHYDHIGGADELHKLTGAPVYLHPADLETARTLGRNLLTVASNPYPKTLQAGGLTFTVHHTPGHTPGCVCLQTENLLISGDTLFFGTCGRTDLPGGSWEQMMASLRLLSGLEGNLSVCPGHGEISTLDAERSYNPYILEAMA